MAKGFKSLNRFYARRRQYSIKAIPRANRKMNRGKNRGPITAASKNQNLTWTPPFGNVKQRWLMFERQLRCHGRLPDSAGRRWRLIGGGWAGLPGARLARPHEIETGQAAVAGRKIGRRSYASFPLRQPFGAKPLGRVLHDAPEQRIIG